MPVSANDLRLIICEDEILLATELAEQFMQLGATIVATLGSVAEMEKFLLEGNSAANAAVLDVQLIDGHIYPVVPRLESMGMALVFYTAYLAQDRPDHCAHIPWLDKLTSARDIVDVLCAAHDARRHDHNI